MVQAPRSGRRAPRTTLFRETVIGGTESEGERTCVSRPEHPQTRDADASPLAITILCLLDQGKASTIATGWAEGNTKSSGRQARAANSTAAWT